MREKGRHGLLIALLAFASIAAADEPQKIALVLGGGGEPAGPTTIFDNGLSGFGQKLKEGGYQVDVAFDGTHSETAKIATSLDAGAASFDEVGIAKKLTSLKAKMAQLKSGDQVLVVVDTHGDPNYLGGLGAYKPDPMLVHKVETNEANQQFDLKALREVQRMADAKGVKLAIVDASCYSGQSLKLSEENPKTCVISATSSTAVGFADFLPNLSVNLRQGRSLEEAFLEARTQTSYGYPEISTAKGSLATKALAAINSQVKVNTYDVFEPGIVLSKKNCKTSTAHIHSQVLALVRINQAALGLAPQNITLLQDALVKYHTQKNQIKEDTMRLVNLNVKVDGIDQPVSGFLLANIEETLPLIASSLPLITIPALRKMNQQLVDHRSELIAKREELIRSDPSLARIFADQKTVKNMNEKVQDLKLQDAAVAYRNFERYAYGAIYRAAPETGATKNGESACRDFKF